MTREWCEQKNRELMTQKKEVKEKFIQEIKQTNYLSEENKNEILNLFKKEPDNYKIECIINFSRIDWLLKNQVEDKEIQSWIDIMLEYLYIYNSKDNYYDYYMDSEPKEFDGDILITDPCYFVKDDDDILDLSAINIPTSISRDTIYGDWSCTVTDSNNNKLGNFCADAGLVCVADLNEVVKYNPDILNQIKECPWAYTVIKNFKGTVQFIIQENEYEHNGKPCLDYEVKIFGQGVNKLNGEPVKFIGCQTGF